METPIFKISILNLVKEKRVVLERYPEEDFGKHPMCTIFIRIFFKYIITPEKKCFWHNLWIILSTEYRLTTVIPETKFLKFFKCACISHQDIINR